jgi:2-dehydro-3-deoxygluconokinase
VTYDRAGSSIALSPVEAYNWNSCLQNRAWFHVTGITPALSHTAADATLAAVRAAKSKGLTVSCDLNFRRKLWNWHAGTPPRELAERTMRGIMPFVDVVIANEEDAEMVLGIKPAATNVEEGRLSATSYTEVAREIVRQFPNVGKVAITLRESISASHNNWGGMLYDARSSLAAFAPVAADGTYMPYEIRNIVDRMGAGDAFAAGLIFALLTAELSDPPRAVAFATAAGCLKHSIPGDMNLVSRTEIEALMKGHASGRVQR